jgi:transposase
MELFLEEFSKSIPPGKHAVLVVDQAGWHKSLDLKIPINISFIFLPPYSPELNPIEQLWQQLKQGWFSNRCFEDYEEIVDIAAEAWNSFTSLPGAIKKLCSRNWAILEG